VRIWQTVGLLAVMGVAPSWGISRYLCGEIARPDFLKSFDLKKTGLELFNALLEDQTAATSQKDACFARRKQILEQIYRGFSMELLKKSEVQISIGRMQLLHGAEDLGAENFRLAMKFEPKNAEAIYYSARRAAQKGKRERERALLESLVFSDFRKRPVQRELFDEAFERLSFLVTASESQALVEGAWRELDKTSLRRAKRGLEIADHFKDAAKMDKLFVEAFASSKVPDSAPSWAHFLKARYFLHKEDLASAMSSFDEYTRRKKKFPLEDYREMEPWLELAAANGSFKYLRNWSELALRQAWAKSLVSSRRTALGRYYVEALRGGAINSKAPIRDLELAQKILPRTPEILLLSAEILLSARPPFKPEAPYQKRKTAYEKARHSLRYLQTQDSVAMDASFWEIWMDSELGRLQQVKGRTDILLVELQEGKAFRVDSTLEVFWVICRGLYTRSRALKDYSAKLKLLAASPRAQESVRQSAEREIQKLPK